MPVKKFPHQYLEIKKIEETDILHTHSHLAHGHDSHLHTHTHYTIKTTIQSAILAHGHSHTYTLRQFAACKKLPYSQA